ncbi:hypothetical protein GCM10020258_59510 [Sphingomonas yabuuchiae]
MRDTDPTFGDLGTGIGARQLGRIGKASVKSARLCGNDAGLPGCDPCRSLAAEFERLIDLECRLLLVGRVPGAVADEVLGIDTERRVRTRARLEG